VTENPTLLEFPCDFPIKTMGRNTTGFRDTVVGLVERHVGQIDEDAIRTAVSRKGNFLSVTITVTAQSQAQLDAIYQDLSDHDDVQLSL
jgi:putative lipoic acid-binding regulatory protein